MARAWARPLFCWVTLKGRFFVAGVWRDYARQFGTVVIDRADFAQLSDDDRTNDLALWLSPGTDELKVQTQLRALADDLGAAG